MDDPARLTAERFEPHVGSTFILSDPPLSLTLAAVDRHGPPAAAGTPGEAFTLAFRHADGPVHGQGMGSLSHTVLGTVELFLVARQPVDGMGVYEADIA